MGRSPLVFLQCCHFGKLIGSSTGMISASIACNKLRSSLRVGQKLPCSWYGPRLGRPKSLSPRVRPHKCVARATCDKPQARSLRTRSAQEPQAVQPAEKGDFREQPQLWKQVTRTCTQQSRALFSPGFQESVESPSALLHRVRAYRMPTIRL